MILPGFKKKMQFYFSDLHGPTWFLIFFHVMHKCCCFFFMTVIIILCAMSILSLRPRILCSKNYFMYVYLLKKQILQRKRET